MFTKRHYEAIAMLFKGLSATNKRFFVIQFGVMFGADNPRFELEKFIKACGC